MLEEFGGFGNSGTTDLQGNLFATMFISQAIFLTLKLI